MSMLPELNFNYKYFLDRSTILYGESGTGKSFIITDILYQLQPHVDQVIVISPTDRQNHTYDKGIVPLPCIHYTVSAELLENIWERQQALTSVYTRANNQAVIKKLFNRVADSKTNGIINSIHRKLHEYKSELSAEIDEGAAAAKIADMEKECLRLITIIWRNTIHEKRDILRKMNLSNEEQYSLKYINLNPRMVLIFDDCTDLLVKFRKNGTLQKLFYQGRWNFISSILACHTDKAFDAELKKNAFMSIYTEDTCAHAYFTRKSNDLDKEAEHRALTASKSAFSPLAKHQKLAFVREEKKFYRFTSTPRTNFRFGCNYLWDYCNRIKADAGSVSTNNKFISDFQ